MGADFDSYRNTFIGFVFQEYNILDEFTVEENIALALELQGKKKDKEAIEDILREVDLNGYAKRKPATLSGGQKQRIAIARALVKNPQIIMGDEPTGALDSNAGKQVFDTLKKLSRDKLVLIVSHDRDFAVAYADRIIELADGQIVSDMVKTEGKLENIDSNVTVTDTGLISVKKGSELTPDAIGKINALLRNTDSDIIISTDSVGNAELRKVGRINDNGGVDVFRQTETQPVAKEYSDEDRAFIRSRLPVAKALKIGASGLKGKPFRLLATVFLSCVAFILFGLMSTFMMYNPAAVKREAIKNSSEKYLSAVLRREWEPLKIGDTTIANIEKATGITPVGLLQADNLAFCGDTLKNTDVRDTNEIYKSVLLPIARISEKQLNSMINIDAVEKVDSASALRINTPFIANIDNASELIGTLGKIFLNTGIALAVFAALLLFNFISASIAQKKKEIGILRAVGARGSDVFKIFFAETLILVVVCLVVSLILSAVLCVAINNIIKNQSAFVSYDLLIFGPLNALIIIAIAAAVAVVGTFVPVFLTARKKPVEAIRSL